MTMPMRCIGSVLALLLAFAAPGSVWAQSSSERLAVQGRLTASGGAAASGSYDFIVHLYDGVGGVVPVYAQSLPAVAVAPSGLYRLTLGPVDDTGRGLDAALAAHTDLWVGITANPAGQLGEPEMTPRLAVGSAAYAFRAKTLDGVGVDQLLRSDQDGVLAGKLTVLGGVEITGAAPSFVPPVLTTAERDQLTPSLGSLIFNRSTSSLEVFDGSGWTPVGGSGGGGSPTPSCNTTPRVFSFVDSVQSIEVPAGCTAVSIKAWGGGGAGGYNSGGRTHDGGAGGFGEATVSVTAGEQLVVVVGEGGARNTTADQVARPGSFGGGGAPKGGAVCAVGAGGGYSGVFRGAVTPADAIVIAGGGGGSSGYTFGGTGNHSSFAGGAGALAGNNGPSAWTGGGGGGVEGGAHHTRDTNSATYPAGEGGTGFAPDRALLHFSPEKTRTPPQILDLDYPGFGTSGRGAVGFGGRGGAYGANCQDAGHGAVVVTFSSPSAAAPNCTPGQAEFSYTGSDQTFTVPTGCQAIRVKAWGAGGGGGYNSRAGGPGGFTDASVEVTPGESLAVVVGGAGQRNEAANQTLGPRSYGGGGGPKGGAVCAVGAGGGLSGVFRGGITNNDALVVAGGGGGASGYTQGGSGNQPGLSGSGSASISGDDGPSAWTGGGGGGYVGGGTHVRSTTNGQYPGGSGGLGFAPVGGTLSFSAEFTRTPPGTGDPDYPGTGTSGAAAVGYGGAGGGYGTNCSAAGHGAVVISWE